MNIVKQLKLTPLERFVHFRREQMHRVVRKWNTTHKRQISYDDVNLAINSLLRKKQTAANATDRTNRRQP